MTKNVAGLFTLLLLLVSVIATSATDSHRPSSPIVVAQRSFLQQTGAITQVLFTPKETGDYRIEVYQNQEASNFGPIIQMTWTDELGEKQTQSDSSIFPSLIITNDGVAATGGQLFVHAVAGHPIKLGTFVNPAQPAYNIFVTVERLRFGGKDFD